ncbi:2460_t:CDS:1 [Acaulospora morrowiae]|uniref:2460_t:CDS:1 n=1 Tax=Acaulospora morrowiae TaxID=94023 RepID=A0A9N9GRK5_9GLOM|nr:2460_t:CDS:1 [Acaulospora morrowiae]
MFDELFRRHSIIDQTRRFDQKSLYEEECRRLIGVVEQLSEQRKEVLEVIRTANSFINDLILSLQSHNPRNATSENPKGTENGRSELLNTISKQRNNVQTVMNEETIDGENNVDEGEFVDVDINADESANSLEYPQNRSNDIEQFIQQHNDEGLKTELVILQSQINRLRVEQTKVTDILEYHKNNCKPSLSKSNGGQYRARSFALAKEDRIRVNDDDNESDGGENSVSSRERYGSELRWNSYMENETYTDLLKRQNREIIKLRQKCKEYEESLKITKSSRRSNSCSTESYNSGKNNRNDGSPSFKSDIKSLQNLLQKFTSVTAETEINQEQANALLELYQLNTAKPGLKTFREKLGHALEAQIVKRLGEQLDGYFSVDKSPDSMEDYDEDNLELDIVSTTEKLVALMTRFVQRRVNDDGLAKQVPKRVRKVVYETLSKHAFSLDSQIFENNKNRINHPFITSLVQELVNFTDQYRTIKHSEGILKVQNEAEKLIREYVSVMWFKLKALDPVPQTHYYPKGTGVNTVYMKGDVHGEDAGKNIMTNGGSSSSGSKGWDIQDTKNLSVEICYFPAIFDERTNTVYSKAQVSVN